MDANPSQESRRVATLSLCIAGGILALTIAVLILLRGGEHSGKAVVVEHSTLYPARSRPLSVLESRGAVQDTLRVDTTDAAVEEGAPAVGGDPRSGDRPSGWVLESRTQRPMSGMWVGLKADRGLGESEAEWRSAITDESGYFLLPAGEEGLAPGNFCRVRVEQEDRTVLLDTIAQVSGSMILIVPSSVLLHGRLRTNGALDPATLVVRAYLPPTESYQSWLCGTGELDSNGRFAIHCRPAKAPTVYRLEFAAVDQNIASVDVPAVELESQAGALIEIEPEQLTVHIRDTLDRGLANVRLRVGLEREGAVVLLATSLTDANGMVRILAPPGNLELCALLSDYEPVTARVPASDREGGVVRLTLRTLSQADRVRGWVRDEAGEGIPGAWVTAVPASLDRRVAMAAMVQDRTGPDGSFELEVSGDQELLIAASHQVYGVTPEALISPGRRPLVLRFACTGSVRLRLTGIAHDPYTSASSLSYWILDRQLRWASHGRADSLPLELSKVHRGSYSMIVRWGLSGYAEASFDVECGESSEVELRLGLVPRIEGTVVDGAGVPLGGLVVAAQRPEWSRDMINSWANSRTDEQGRFDVLGSWQGPVELVLSRDGEVLSQREVPGEGSLRLQIDLER